MKLHETKRQSTCRLPSVSRLSCRQHQGRECMARHVFAGPNTEGHDGVAHLVERRIRDPQTGGSTGERKKVACVWPASKCVRTLKIPYPSVVNEYRPLTADDRVETRKHYTPTDPLRAGFGCATHTNTLHTNRPFESMLQLCNTHEHTAHQPTL